MSDDEAAVIAKIQKVADEMMKPLLESGLSLWEGMSAVSYLAVGAIRYSAGAADKCPACIADRFIALLKETTDLATHIGDGTRTVH